MPNKQKKGLISLKKKKIYVSVGLTASFVLWTILVQIVDVKPIGPEESKVGFTALNSCFHNLTGVNMTLYAITDWLGLVPIAVALGFAVLGLIQWIKRKNILKVDRSILALGGFYILTITAYILFEYVVINRRPVLINGYLEASYPSSTTLLVLCVMPTAMMQFNERIKNKAFKITVNSVVAVFVVFMVVGRLLSGVHWITDIIGGVLLSSGLVMLYSSVVNG